MIPYIVDEVMLSRSPHVGKARQGLSRMTPSSMEFSPTLRCVLQLRISCPQWPVLNGVKG